MTKQYLYGLLFFVTVIVLGSCYKDKGNYDYTDTDEVVLKTIRDTFNVVLPDSLKINLTIEESMANAADLSFQWVLYPTATPLTRRTLDTTQNLKAFITELPGSYYLTVYAKDRKTGLEYQKRVYVSVISPYSEGWLVVEEKNGACDISMISPIDTIFRNIYSTQNNGELLPAGTNRIPEIRTYSTDQRVFIISPADMIQVNYSNFAKIMDFPEFFWETPAVVKPQEYFANSYDEMMLNNGKIHSRSLNVPPNSVNKLNLPPEGKYYIAPYEIYTGSGYEVYDTIGQKFYMLNTASGNLTPITITGTPIFNMNNIGKKLLYTEVNTSGGQCNAFFKNNNDDSLFAFVYNYSSSQTTTKERYDGLNAPGLKDARLFVGSRLLQLLYYASGNSIYKLDIPAKTAAPIYTFPAGTEIRAMKMYRNLKNSKDPNHNNLIAVATHENGQGKVYYFPLATTGNFTNNTYSKVFTGFNKINEITFKSQK
ncbi:MULTISPECIES: PKD-like family lipoprotein [Niastella]|uniref:PKD domain-containing protein n=1 Tax=Niastella soli TaxID=2821487 RepID=A0ABS3YUP1_9BACT|nr:PKD-like family lipoprotein [Niastella soli]MBO9201600.1 hypothetical protein [Niastella soli]